LLHHFFLPSLFLRQKTDLSVKRYFVPLA